jgi:TonB family protein
VLADAYPDKAWTEDVPGEATALCNIVRRQVLERCELVSESPAGYGFGAALLQMAPKVSLSPYGASLNGMTVTEAPRGRAQVHFAFKTPRPTQGGVLVMIGTITRHFPERAQRTETGGMAELQCKVAETGRLADCVVTQENPAGMGFGPSALASAHHFRVAPGKIKEWAGKALRTPIKFSIN